jgi:hypothetical protein
LYPIIVLYYYRTALHRTSPSSNSCTIKRRSQIGWPLLLLQYSPSLGVAVAVTAYL